MAYSRVVAIGDGSTTQFAVNFALDYLKEEDVTCRVGTESDGSGDPLYRPITFLSTNLYQVGGAPAGNGVQIVFERTVDKEHLLVDYHNGDQIDEDNLTIMQKQAIMLVHEVIDGRTELGNTVAADAEAAIQARAGAEAARENIETWAAEVEAGKDAAAVSASAAAGSATGAATSATGAAASKTAADAALAAVPATVATAIAAYSAPSTAMSISGLTPSNSLADSQNDITVSAGRARDSTKTYDIILPTGMTKRSDAVWSIGDNGGGLDTGTKVTGASYHIFLIRRTSDGLADILFSASPTNPVLPTGWSAFRRIHSFRTGSAAGAPIAPGKYFGGWFEFTNKFQIYSSTSVAALTLYNFSVPVGIKVRAKNLYAFFATDSGAGYVHVNDPDIGAYDTSNAAYARAFQGGGASVIFVSEDWTNTAGQLYLYSAAGANAKATVYQQGWFDPRDEFI
jgi:hypothetical protein